MYSISVMIINVLRYGSQNCVPMSCFIELQHRRKSNKRQPDKLLWEWLPPFWLKIGSLLIYVLDFHWQVQICCTSTLSWWESNEYNTIEKLNVRFKNHHMNRFLPLLKLPSYNRVAHVSSHRAALISINIRSTLLIPALEAWPDSFLVQYIGLSHLMPWL